MSAGCSASSNDSNISVRFGSRSLVFRHSLQVLREAWRRAGEEPMAQGRFAVWRGLLAIAGGGDVGSEELFLRHTYLAILSRVLVFAALRQRPPDPAEVGGIIDGEAFQELGLEGFVEADDPFAWAKGDAEVETLLRTLAAHLIATCDISNIQDQGDLLGELYQELVDPEVRRGLGEFYTPGWLAELALRQAGFPSARSLPSLLDPACGSGVFLVTAVRLLREAGLRGSDLTGFCASRLAGMDIHPLAVAIARANLILALGDDLRGASGPFPVPVHLADSLILPEDRGWPILAIPANGGEPGRDLPTAFHLPLEPAVSADRLDGAINALLVLSDPQIGDAEAGQRLSARLAALGIPQEHWWCWRSNLRLMRWMRRGSADSVAWAAMLAGAARAARIAKHRFAFVAGNPPWVPYRQIGRQDLRERTRRLALEYRLLSGTDGHLFTHIDLATIFFAFCSDRYLADDGTMVFVMPRSVLTGAKQYAGFQRRFVASARLIIDCSQVRRLFPLPACVVVWNKGREAGGVVPVLRISGDPPPHRIPWERAREILRVTEASFTPPGGWWRSPYLGRIRAGATIVPRSFWFVRPTCGQASDPERPLLETDPRLEPRAKVPWRGIRLRGSVETDFLFATLLSDDMLPFGYRQLSLVVLPLMGRRLISADEADRMGKVGLAAWLKEADRIWRERRRSRRGLLEALDWHSKLSDQSATGACRLLYNSSGKHLCACVVDARGIGGWRVRGLPVQGFVVEKGTNWLDADEDEAHYLCAVLNAPCVDAFIKPIQPHGELAAQRQISRIPFEALPIPLFNPADERHRGLARLSRACHERVARFVAKAGEAVLERPISHLRWQVREMLAEELSRINRIVADLLGLMPRERRGG